MYKVTLTKEQIEILLPAIDLASRIHLGQISEVANYCNHRTNLRKTDFYEGREALNNFKRLVMPPDFVDGMSYGICNTDVSDEARALHDIFQVLRNKLAWDTLPEDATSSETIYVQFDKPHRWSDTMDLPVIEKIED